MSNTNGLFTRKELFWRKIADSSVEVPEPVTREEMFLAKLAGMDVVAPTPSSRAEMYLAAAAGEDVVLPEPVSRDELFLAKMAGMDVITPEPVTREEIFLSMISSGETIKTTEVVYTYDGDNTSEDRTWLYLGSGKKALVKVGDIPEGNLNLVGGHVSVLCSDNSWLNYNFDITEEMLDEVATRYSVDIPASQNGLTQIFYGTPSDGGAKSVQLLICTRAGTYNVAFSTWLENIQIKETGVYLFDGRNFGSSYYAEYFECTVTTGSS